MFKSAARGVLLCGKFFGDNPDEMMGYMDQYKEHPGALSLIIENPADQHMAQSDLMNDFNVMFHTKCMNQGAERPFLRAGLSSFERVGEEIEGGDPMRLDNPTYRSQGEVYVDIVTRLGEQDPYLLGCLTRRKLDGNGNLIQLLETRIEEVDGLIEEYRLQNTGESRVMGRRYKRKVRHYRNAISEIRHQLGYSREHEAL